MTTLNEFEVHMIAWFQHCHGSCRKVAEKTGLAVLEVMLTLIAVCRLLAIPPGQRRRRLMQLRLWKIWQSPQIDERYYQVRLPAHWEEDTHGG